MNHRGWLCGITKYAKPQPKIYRCAGDDYQISILKGCAARPGHQAWVLWRQDAAGHAVSDGRELELLNKFYRRYLCAIGPNIAAENEYGACGSGNKSIDEI